MLHGPAGSGPQASVDVAFAIKHGHAKTIGRFEFNNIPASCKGSAPTAVSDKFAHSIRVSSKGSFHASEKTNRGFLTYTVSGRFLTLHKAAGTLRIKGAVPGCASADTGKVHWSAKG